MDDVRVKLSAEGVEQIVGAMRTVKQEAEKTSSAGAQYFSQWRKEIEKIGPALAGMLAAGALIAKVKGLSTEVQNQAVQMAKLSQATGLSTDALQVYTKAAGKSEEAQAALSKGLSIFTRTTGQAELGSKKAVQGFSDINVKVKDFVGLNADQKMQLVADRIIGIEDPAKRAAVGFEFFGKSFQQMYPILLKVHNEGFGPMLDRMKELGIYMDGDMIKQMRNVKKAMGEMGEEAKGMVTQFLAGMLPGVQATMEGILKATNTGGVSGFKKLGEAVGWLVNVVQKAMTLIGTTIGETFGNITTFATKQIDVLSSKASLLDKAKALINLTPVGMAVGVTQGASNMTGTAAAAKDLYSAITEGPKTDSHPAEKPEATTVEPRNQAATAAARLALIEARLQAEQRLYDAQAALKLDTERQQYEAGKLSLEQYFDDRESIMRTKYDKELNILEQRRKAVAAQPIDKNDVDGTASLAKQAELARISGDIATKQVERETSLMQLATERGAAQRQNYQDMQAAEAKLLAIQGDRAGAARKLLDIELERMRVELQRSGKPAAEIDSALGGLRAQGNAKIDYDEAKRDADATLSQLDSQIRAIQDQVRAGLLFPIQGEQQIMALERERLPLLEQTAANLQKIATATGDSTLVAQADAFSQKVGEIATATDDAGNAMATLKQTAQGAAEGGLATFFDNISTGAMSVTGAFRGMALGFASSLSKMESEYLSKQFIKWLNGDTGGGGGGGGAGGSVGMFASVAALFAASGGQISGPGTSTSDSVPAMLSNGEFVVNAKATQQPGMLALLHAINGTPGAAGRGSAGAQRYAEGGAVAGGGGGLNLKLVNVPDSSLLADHLDTAVGEQQIINILARNPSRVRQAIG